MKSFFKKLCLFLVPFLLLVFLFFVFEPYDYFLVRGDAAYLTRPLSSMRELLLQKPGKLIFGDSKMANLNTDVIYDITGDRYTSLAFGGATMPESIELFWFAAKHTQMTDVVFGVGFYTSRAPLDGARIAPLVNQAENPLVFLSSFDNWVSALDNVKIKTKNVIGRLFNQPNLIELPDDPTATLDTAFPPAEIGKTYRENLESYAALLRENIGETYVLPDSTLDALDKIIVYCDANGINITFVFTPMHASVQTLVVQPLHIDDDIARYKQFLIARANVIDMEFSSGFNAEESNFYDSFHLMGSKKIWLAEMIFTDTASPDVRRYNKGDTLLPD